MATGTHAVLDKGGRSPDGSTVARLLVGAAHAQDSQPITPTLRQERPFFYDWTRGFSAETRTPAGEHNPIVFTAQKDFGAVKGFLVNAGLATPSYKVTVAIDKSRLPANTEIKAVTWSLPQAYFQTGNVTLTESTTNFAVEIEAWKPFKIEAELQLASGETVRSDQLITFGATGPK
jgi:hypothetical protein